VSGRAFNPRGSHWRPGQRNPTCTSSATRNSRKLPPTGSAPTA
jgi:hypothetical protein